MSKKECNNEGKEDIVRNIKLFCYLPVEKVFHRCE